MNKGNVVRIYFNVFDRASFGEILRIVLITQATIINSLIEKESI